MCLIFFVNIVETLDIVGVELFGAESRKIVWFYSKYWRVLSVHYIYMTPHISYPIFFVSRGENSGSQAQEIVEQVKVLKAHISELEIQEKALDDQKEWLEENIKLLQHDPTYSTYPFMQGTEGVGHPQIKGVHLSSWLHCLIIMCVSCDFWTYSIYRL